MPSVRPRLLSHEFAGQSMALRWRSRVSASSLLERMAQKELSAYFKSGEEDWLSTQVAGKLDGLLQIDRVIKLDVGSKIIDTHFHKAVLEEVNGIFRRIVGLWNPIGCE